MKYLIMTEGVCEKGLLDVLLKRGLLIYSYSDLLYQEIFHARQITFKLLEMINQLPPQEMITIIRIGDKLSDELDLSEVEDRVTDQRKICIKPEFEILHVINEGMFDGYQKVKNKQKVCEYYLINNQSYRKTYDFNYSYFDEMSDEELVALLKHYDIKRKGCHKKGEMTITSIIRGC